MAILAPRCQRMVVAQSSPACRRPEIPHRDGTDATGRLPAKVELHASAAQIAVYLIAYATLVVTGGRLGDIYGARNVFISGVAGFTVTSLWCALAQSGPELIAARLAQGTTAALMVPQVLAHLICCSRMPRCSFSFSPICRSTWS
jgi:MFS family permease